MEWLSEKARIFLHMIPSIHQHLEIPAIPELTIFSGSQKRGIYATGQAPKPRIFLHEKSLTNFKLFLKTYLMALAELQTGQTGVARPFVDFFVRSWSQLIQKTLE
jgi:hypothetical protein